MLDGKQDVSRCLIPRGNMQLKAPRPPLARKPAKICHDRDVVAGYGRYAIPLPRGLADQSFIP